MSREYDDLYEHIKNKLLQQRRYTVRHRKVGEAGNIDNIEIIDENENSVGYINFSLITGETHYKRKNPEDAVVENVIYIIDVSVNEEYRGQHISYYLIILSMLYSKINYPHINKAILDDCSDQSGLVVRNLYIKIGMSVLGHQELLLPNERDESVPISRKRGSYHVEIPCGERVGNIDYMIYRITILLNLTHPFTFKATSRGKKSRGVIRKKKTKKNTRFRKMRKTKVHRK
jgi:hypothetical protein